MDLKTMLNEDFNLNLTDDLPSLRYRNEDVYVFLWDGLACKDNFKSRLCDPTEWKDYQLWSKGVTVNSYAPFYECSGDTDLESLCLEETDDVSFINDLEGTETMPMEGMIYKVSLDTLMNLDWHYENGYNYNRVMIDVKPNRNQPASVITCFTYLNDIDHIADFDQKSGKYVLKKEISLVSFGSGPAGLDRKEAYKFG